MFFAIIINLLAKIFLVFLRVSYDEIPKKQLPRHRVFVLGGTTDELLRVTYVSQGVLGWRDCVGVHLPGLVQARRVTLALVRSCVCARRATNSNNSFTLGL